jgi:hypothetical protein
MLVGYLVADIDPTDPSNKTYNDVHECCAYHITNLIVKCGLKRLNDYLDMYRTVIIFDRGKLQPGGEIHPPNKPDFSMPPSSSSRTSEREMCPWAISKCFGDLVSNTSA